MLSSAAFAGREDIVDLWSILRCVVCGAAVERTADVCRCTRCAAEWPLVRGEIPYFAGPWIETHPEAQDEIQAQGHALATYVDPHTFSFHWNLQRMQNAVRRLREDAIVLDLGCGPGLLAEIRDAEQVVGVDLSPDLLREAQQRLPHLVGAAAERLPLATACVDAVLARGVLHHVVDPHAAVAELCRVLRPGGIAVLSDPRAFAPLERVKKLLRRRDPMFAETHRAFGRQEYCELVSRSGLQIVQVEDEDPLFLPWFVLGDVLRLGRHVDARRTVASLLLLEGSFMRLGRRIPGLRHFGFITQVVARKQEDV